MFLAKAAWIEGRWPSTPKRLRIDFRSSLLPSTTAQPASSSSIFVALMVSSSLRHLSNISLIIALIALLISATFSTPSNGTLCQRNSREKDLNQTLASMALGCLTGWWVNQGNSQILGGGRVAFFEGITATYINGGRQRIDTHVGLWQALWRLSKPRLHIWFKCACNYRMLLSILGLVCWLLSFISWRSLRFSLLSGSDLHCPPPHSSIKRVEVVVSYRLFYLSISQQDQITRGEKTPTLSISRLVWRGEGIGGFPMYASPVKILSSRSFYPVSRNSTHRSLIVRCAHLNPRSPLRKYA